MSSSRIRVPEAAVLRLTAYLRAVERLAEEGVATVSSREVAARTGVSDAQFRKDLSYFGEFGVRGRGYDVQALGTSLRTILALHRRRNLVIIGVGNLGRALLGFPGFRREPFEIVSAFDSDRAKVGAEVHGVRVRDIRALSRFARSRPIHIAILAVPASAAQAAAGSIQRAGIAAVLNFAPVHLDLPPDVIVRDVDLARELDVISYWLPD